MSPYVCCKHHKASFCDFFLPKLGNFRGIKRAFRCVIMAVLVRQRAKVPDPSKAFWWFFFVTTHPKPRENSWLIPRQVSTSKGCSVFFFVCLKSCLSVWVKKCWKSYPTNSELHVLSLIEAGCWLLQREIEWSTKHVKCICASKLDSQSWTQYATSSVSVTKTEV